MFSGYEPAYLVVRISQLGYRGGFMNDQEPSASVDKRQRMSGLLNGVVIGIGIGSILESPVIAVLLICLGIGTEFVQRRRLNRNG